MDIKPILLSLKHNKFMAFLVIIQVAFTMGVLTSSILIAATTLRAWNMPSGIPHNDVIRISPQFYEVNKNIEQAIIRDIERVQQMPGVVNIAPSNAVPFTAENVIKVFTSAEKEAQPYRTVVFESDENLFDVLSLQLIEGRWLTAADVIKGEQANLTERAPVVMVSEDMAKALFGDSSAIGQTIWLEAQGDPVQIVGIYNNFMTGERLNGNGLSYHSIIRPQVTWSSSEQPHYLIRMEQGMASASLEDILAIFYQERGRYINSSELLKRTQKRMYDGRGSRALTFLVISAVLVIITALGITGLTAFQITQKRKQIGARRALGAKKSDIMRYFLTENSILTLTGLLIGLALTLSITFEVSERMEENVFNVGIFAVTALALWLINLLAVWFPAKRAANVAPAIVTRSA
ncbi:ABC transporter permease [Thalassotalea insulae]|uniref:ABC transporter permease n=1 Tax=Thalassotalea insulae TaxID=2056778 RepID=A0ABQ6GUK1_9GAMM|nr:FtsX-like permease family protein [Thalassotalea insulae]GLX78350.1 ABC transporter permease [Thalassotalea insulae]